MKQHISVVAAIRIGFGVIDILLALVVFAVLAGVGIIVNDRTALGILILVGAVTSLVLLVLGVPNIVGGIGLIRLKPWARYLVLVFSVLDLFNIPFGLVAGLYSIWVLIQDQTISLFTQKADSIEQTSNNA